MILAIFSPINVILAGEDTTFNVSIEPNILGEVSNIKLSLLNLPFLLNTETNLSINFPPGFNLPKSISLDSVIIDKGLSSLKIDVYSNSVSLRLPATNLESISITILKSAQIRNPIEYNGAIKILVVFEEKKFFIESDSLFFKRPENSILLDRGVKIMTSSGWIPEEFDLKLSSPLSNEIYYSLDNSEFSLYKNSIRITNGVHEIKYFGVRISGAKEAISSTKYYVDSVKPSIALLDPPDGSFINELTPELTFAIKDFSPVTVFIGENKAIVNDSGFAKLKITLKPGENKLEAIAIDTTNYKEFLKFTIFVDITPPTLVILAPKNKEIICNDSVEIVGKAEIGSDVFIENYKVKLDSYGNFSFKYLPPDGLNKIIIKAKDKAKNERVEYLEFYFSKANFIEFFIGKSTAIVDGKEVEIFPPPFLDGKSGEVYLPLRFISSNLGFDLRWNDKESYAILSFIGKEAIIKPNDPLIRLRSRASEKEILLVNPPTIFKGSIVVPAEFLNKILNAQLIYDSNGEKIIAKFCLRSGGEA